MNKPNKDWKLILKTNTYNGIFIKNSKDYNCLSNLYINLEEIEKIKEEIRKTLEESSIPCVKNRSRGISLFR